MAPNGIRQNRRSFFYPFGRGVSFPNGTAPKHKHISTYGKTNLLKTDAKVQQKNETAKFRGLARFKIKLLLHCIGSKAFKIGFF